MSVYVKTNSFNACFKSKAKSKLKAKSYTPLINYKASKNRQGSIVMLYQSYGYLMGSLKRMNILP
ncbi:hypothetical protein [Commensalibacter communis]|uniref:hypothetical protein n=1 Tax=Commensalibacter communis TaxID=2972786 RepID=UPI0022FF6A8F|nr:hypothetical protein [Commensalibacter communis]CAI3949859.1 unnamed protein product [Commensalibacter communis]CAI3956644.1 unnamed protein product [Commensalibacter communis]